ncbi:MAG: hypothetical protein QG658_176 [Patescibacteria group bacterium]|nr:hypothetical protein [Patescibacteria group bacterium]
MSRPTGSKNISKLPKIVQADEKERLEYIAALLLEIIDEEINGRKARPCNQTL